MPEDMPEEYRIQNVTYKADDAAIRAALDAGQELPFAKLGERGTHLRVR